MRVSTAEVLALVELLVDLVGKLVWPALILILVLLFRPQVGAVLNRLKALTAGPIRAELESGRVLDEAAAELLAEGSIEGSADLSAAAALVTTDPPGSIAMAWQRVTEINNEAQSRVRGGDYHPVSPLRRSAVAIEQFAREGYIDHRYAEVGHALFDEFVRPEVATSAEAIVYLLAAQELANALVTAAPKS